MLQGLPIMVFGNATNFALFIYALNIAYYAGNDNKLAEPMEVLCFCMSSQLCLILSLPIMLFGNASARP